MRLTIFAAGALLPLAACNQGPSTEESARRTGDIRLENASVEEVAKQAAAAETKAPGKPGQWETSMQLVALEPGAMPEAIAAKMQEDVGKPPRTERGCRKTDELKPLDISRLGAMAPGCRFSKYRFVGGKLDAAMECDTPMGKAQASFSGTQTPTAFDLTMTQRQTPTGQAKATSMTLRLTGKRLGECKA
ncbi:DUF3617 domain-containing protein [Sphingomonas sp. NPDC092331]|jgi:Protein of unknown function (DUF3617)|uniref:DUF3617 domain-containing protein n=1 Tax=unclassified Sphingomonas TaxID=196159 RepID=UPI0031F47DFB